MKVFISGKITGIEADAEDIFLEVEEYLKNKGCSVVNPMKLPHNHDKTWESYMKETLTELLTCDAIYILSNAKDSKGAELEIRVAKATGIIPIYQDDLLE